MFGGEVVAPFHEGADGGGVDGRGDGGHGSGGDGSDEGDTEGDDEAEGSLDHAGLRRRMTRTAGGARECGRWAVNDDDDEAEWVDGDGERAEYSTTVADLPYWVARVVMGSDHSWRTVGTATFPADEVNPLLAVLERDDDGVDDGAAAPGEVYGLGFRGARPIYRQNAGQGLGFRV